jgi:hypothetical protein
MWHRMSAQATFSGEGARRRFPGLETIAACGPLAVVLVACGGVGLGFYAWYVAAVHLGSGALLESAFVIGILGGMLAALAGWLAYGAYFARRAGIGVVTAMRYDAWSWAALGVGAIGILAPVGSPSRTAALAAGLFALVKLLVAARFVHTVRDVLVTFVVTRIPIIVIAELASITLAQRPGIHTVESTNPLLAVWARWDAVHYLDIARRGYIGTDMAFFPLYPVLIAFVGHFIGNDLIAALIISNAAFFFGLLFFYKLVEHEFTRAVAHRAIFYVSIFPTAVFFSAAYTESLFFALTVASFYYIREHRWLTAGAIGALAALTRVEGVLLAIPYAIEVFAAARAEGRGGEWRRFFSRRRGARIALGALAMPLGLATYMAWLWVLRGDPLYFSKVQAHWNRHLAPPWVSIAYAWHVVTKAYAAHATVAIANESIELAFTVLMIVALFAGFKRLRPSFIAYMALSILVPMSTSSLMSMQRFALVLFPMFAIFALWGSRPWVNNAIVAFSLPLLAFFTVLFANWYWVA